jgi:hypothetical protein
MSEAWTFTVDRNFKLPAISIISPLNQSYSKNEIPLTYTIDAKTAQIKWAYFTLDSIGSDSYRGDNFDGNITLSNLADGPHSIKLEVLTENGTFKQITYFNIDTTAQTSPTQSPTSNPALLPTANTGPQVNYGVNPLQYVIGIIAIGTAIIGCLLIYFKRRRDGP